MPTRVLPVIVLLGGLALLSGCGVASAASRPDAVTRPGASASAAPPVAISAPAAGATGVSTATELALTGAGPDTAVTLTDAGGNAVPGALRPDGSSWVPATQLKYGTTYTAAVGGRTVTFTTMSRPGTLIRVSTPLQDDTVYGVAMPLVVNFDRAVPADQRAAVQRRLFVTSQPAQLGTWNWFSGTEVHYRPKDYWQEGTKLSLRVATGGLALGAGAFGGADLTIHASIGDKVEMVTDNATKTMTVSVHDQVVRSIPVSLGKPSKPSSSGHLVVMAKAQSELFVGTDPGDGYRTTVYWTQRLTIGGEYLHAAPWSVADQGKRNVSHGCTNMSTENAKWLWQLTHVGDPVTVKGTGVPLVWGNGLTDWDRDWDRYVQGSALPTR
jgi:lipoprotein-anchoring transpeptidase ErfK/SrfK